jgi:uncharacterized protein YdhG (YjbR/CyaY superfamily)
MHPERPKVATVDEYIALFPIATQAKLRQLRKLVQKVAPEAEEKISYAIPAYRTRAGSWAYFAAYENHLSLYPIPRNVTDDLLRQLEQHKAGKGTLRFSLDKPLPLELIRKVFKQLLILKD